jgi:tetratricopeptide (TPR) repeat protein
MKNTFLSRFTPSSMKPETLEAIFVQRHELVKDLIEAIKESALTKNKHFRLLIGGRGMGKTHTISLIYHRLAKDEEIEDKLLIAWMREEEWGVSSFLDLLLRIFRALEKVYPEKYKAKLEQEIKAIYQMSSDVAEHKAEQLLREFVDDRTLLLLMENLDDIFNGLGDIGQQQFRACIQNYSFITILATSQRLFNGVKQKNAAFYGFFYPQYLEQLELDEVIGLLKRIAKVQGDKDLESFIASSTGRDRIRAIHHLAGGNHRVYVIFAEFLTRQSLDDLLEPFMQTLDELTPYYQARMQWLSPQQRKIIDFLCDRRHPITVKEIAQYCFITHQTASSQLKDLREKGYVRVEAIGRESFYDLQEVLMRYCLDVKKQRGEPISLFIDFLRCWYTKDELQESLNKLNAEFQRITADSVSIKMSDSFLISQTDRSYALEREYISLALQKKEEEEKDSRISAYLQEFQNCLKQAKSSQDIENALDYLEKLSLINNNLSVEIKKSYCLFILGRYEEAVASSDRAITINSEDDSAWDCRGNALFELGRYEEAVEAYDRVIAINSKDDSAWDCRGNALFELGRYEEAVEAYDRVIAINSENDSAWFLRGVALDKLGRLEEAVTSYDRAIKIIPDNDFIWNVHSWALIKLDRYNEALESCDRAIELNPKYSSAFFHRSICLLALNRWDEGIQSLKDALDRLTDGEKPPSEDIEIIIRNLLNNTQNLKHWKSRIKTLLEIFDRYEFVSVLGQGIIKNIPALMSEMVVSDKAAQTWLETWQELTGDRPEFQIPLRFLNTAVRYKQTKGDRRVLLELAIEERSLLEPLLERDNS